MSDDPETGLPPGERALRACRWIVAWADSDDAGPDYGTMTRDTHPEGERIWREWWDRQQRLCAAAFDEARAALAAARVETGTGGGGEG